MTAAGENLEKQECQIQKLSRFYKIYAQFTKAK
jgi:hypothetical protein